MAFGHGRMKAFSVRGRGKVKRRGPAGGRSSLHTRDGGERCPLRRTGKYGKEKDMIFSASRRTDIPTYYSEWLCNRLEAGNVCVRHDARRVTRYVFSREAVDCLVLWTKNPLPLLDRLALLRGWPCVFQFTLTGYGRDVEPGLLDKLQLVEAMKRLSEAFGSERVIWRYDPIFFSGAYSLSWHVRCFERWRNGLKALRVRVSSVFWICTRSSAAGYRLLGSAGTAGRLGRGCLPRLRRWRSAGGYGFPCVRRTWMSPVSSTRVASAVSLSSGWPDAALMSVPRNRGPGASVWRVWMSACTAPAGTDASIVTPTRTASPWGGARRCTIPLRRCL